MSEKLFIRQPEIGERLYGGLDVLSVWPGELEQRARLAALIEDLTAPEFWHLRRGRMGCVGASVAASAGNISGVQLVPDNANQTLAVVERVIIANPNAAALNFQVGIGIAAAGGVAINPTQRDDRDASPITPGTVSGLVCQQFQAAVNPNVGQATIVRLLPDTTLVIEGPWILTSLPLIAKCTTVNSACAATFHWRERALNPTET